jgi:hypothetical protein
VRLALFVEERDEIVAVEVGEVLHCGRLMSASRVRVLRQIEVGNGLASLRECSLSVNIS